MDWLPQQPGPAFLCRVFSSGGSSCANASPIFRHPARDGLYPIEGTRGLSKPAETKTQQPSRCPSPPDAMFSIAPTRLDGRFFVVEPPRQGFAPQHPSRGEGCRDCRLPKKHPLLPMRKILRADTRPIERSLPAWNWTSPRSNWMRTRSMTFFLEPAFRPEPTASRPMLDEPIARRGRRAP